MRPVYAYQHWDQKPTWETAAAITVSDGKTTTCRLRMQAGGHVVGTVTDTQGRPLSGIVVTAFPVDQGEGVRSANTDAEGRYDISGLPTGAVVVEAQDFTQYYLY